MALLSMNHFSLSIALFCIAFSSCRAQDPITIVARAALCFDNRTVINGCLQSMGININGPTAANTTTATSTTNSISTTGSATQNGAGGLNGNSGMCGTPCYGQMMLMMSCVDGIMSNFQGYSPGLMQGVQAIFQMSCGVGNNNNNTNNNNGTDSGPSTVNGESHVAEIGSTVASNGVIEIISPKSILSFSFTTLLISILLLLSH